MHQKLKGRQAANNGGRKIERRLIELRAKRSLRGGHNKGQGRAR